MIYPHAVWLIETKTYIQGIYFVIADEEDFRLTCLKPLWPVGFKLFSQW